MSVTQVDWFAYLRPSYWYNWWTRANELLPVGMELEKLAIVFISVVLIPTIVGAILGIIWNIIWVFLVGLFILLGSVILFKAILPRAPCSTPDMIISILISAGLYIPTLILDGISSVMYMANSKH